jgi:hypothetical protein
VGGIAQGSLNDQFTAARSIAFPIEENAAFWPAAPAACTPWRRFRLFQQADITTLPNFNEALSTAT